MSNLKIWFDRLWPYFLQELPKICNPAQMFCLSIAKSKSHYFDLQNLRYELRTQFLAIVPTSQTMHTLLVQDFRQQKNYPLLIQCSRPSRDSQEPKTTKKFSSCNGPFILRPHFWKSVEKWFQKSGSSNSDFFSGQPLFSNLKKCGFIV